jgi:quercetin dioxygenase-like cupin family protein
MKPWAPDRATALGERLAQRARQSVQAHREYRTKRREDLVWTELAPGASEALLDAGAQARATLVRLEPGAQLPWPAGTMAQEILVVQGSLLAQPAGQPPVTMQGHALALRSSADAGQLTASSTDEPTLLYVRQMLVEPTQLPGPEGQWWRLPRAPLQVVPAAGRRWRQTFDGVEVLPMWGSPDITSMLVRFAPGASVPDHPHAAHEDCLMLEGEMFLGDILLRPGDYQLAPAGGGHFGETSDVGCTFFFHGAIDPVLVPPPRA